jgi:hypothetical protein
MRIVFPFQSYAQSINKWIWVVLPAGIKLRIIKGAVIKSLLAFEYA